MQNNNWNSLKNDYENLSTKPSEELWEKLDNQLHNKETKTVSKFNLIKIAAVFLLFLTVGAIYYFNQNQEVLKNNIENNTKLVEKIPAKKTVDLIKLEDKTSSENENSAISSEKKTATNSPKTKVKLIAKLPAPNIKIINIDSENSTEKLALKPDLKLNPETANIQKIAEVQYIKADELLFARELNRNDNKENIQKKAKMGFIDANGISKPKSVKILGFTVYSDSADSN